jgi:hypothetical protein
VRGWYAGGSPGVAGDDCADGGDRGQPEEQSWAEQTGDAPLEPRYKVRSTEATTHPAHHRDPTISGHRSPTRIGPIFSPTRKPTKTLIPYPRGHCCITAKGVLTTPESGKQDPLRTCEKHDNRTAKGLPSGLYASRWTSSGKPIA